jgi:hypothetical protein
MGQRRPEAEGPPARRGGRAAVSWLEAGGPPVELGGWRRAGHSPGQVERRMPRRPGAGRMERRRRRRRRRELGGWRCGGSTDGPRRQSRGGCDAEGAALRDKDNVWRFFLIHCLLDPLPAQEQGRGPRKHEKPAKAKI